MLGLKRIMGMLLKKEMTCRLVRELSSDHLEGNLPPSFLERVQTHLERCRPCETFVKSLAATLKLLSDMGRKKSPESLKTSILHQIRQEEEGHP